MKGQSKLESFGFDVQPRPLVETPIEQNNLQKGCRVTCIEKRPWQLHLAQVEKHAPDPLSMTCIQEELITPPPLTFDDVCIQEELMSPPPLSFNNPEVPIHEESVPLTPFKFDSVQMATVPSKRRHEDNKTELEGH
jgi:hypothetical protein